MGPEQPQRSPAAIDNRRQRLILHLAMAGLFLLDLALPHGIALLSYYFLLVVLSASFASPRQMVLLIVQAYGQAIAAGFFSGSLPSLNYLGRLVALTALAIVAVWLSAQRQRELALRRRSEQILNLTLDNAAAGVGLADASGKLLRVNPALCSLLGRDEDTLVGLNWQEITQPDDIALEQPLVEAMLANRRDSYRLKKRYLRGDGSSLWVDLSVACVRGPDGRLEFFIAQIIDISHEVESRQALARSEDMLRRTLEQCATGLALCAPDTGAILQANAQLCSLLGLTPAELEGGSLTQVIGALEGVRADGSEVITPIDPAALEALLRGESDVYNLCVRFQRADGRMGWGDLQLTDIRDAQGVVMHVLLELDDITEVVAQAEYLQTAAAAGVVGIWDWDPVHDVLTWDAVMYRIYGVQPETFSGALDAWSQTVHPEDRSFAEGALRAAVRGEQDYAIRFRVLWPDGSVHYIQAASRRFFDREGRVVRIMGVNYDVTELVVAQEQLAAEQQRLSTTLDSLLDPHLLLGPVRDDTGSIVDLRILRANPAAAAYNHMSLEEFVGSTLRQFWPSHRDNGLLDRYLQVLATGEPLVLDNFEYRDHERLGTTRYFDIRVVKVGEELSAICHDVSERIAMQQALQRRAATDSLTTLLNREEVFRTMDRLLAEDQRQGEGVAVLFIDVDKFKQVNDRYGHQAGDAVLQAMAERIRSCLRTSDLAARIGGDELMVVLPGVQALEDALTIAEKLRCLASEPVPIAQGHAQVSLSIGVTLAAPGEEVDALIARADAAMYEAKQRGRDEVVAIAGTASTSTGAPLQPRASASQEP